MAVLDRAIFITLLHRLGEKNDATVLAAARELHQSVLDSGVSWDDLLRPESGEPGAFPDAADGSETPADDVPVTQAPHLDELAEEPDAASATVSESVTAADRNEVGKLIDRLLARKNLSRTLRQDITEIKRSVADRSIDAMDCNYIRALANRLGVS